MTLGGLALAIGMLVDDATVEVENIHRNRDMGKPLTRAILDGAQQIAVPAIVATLSICIVFFPVVLLVGPARFLFTPLAISVVLAMLASYLLSRTLVPALARLLMHSEHHDEPGVGRCRAGGWKRLAVRFNRWRDRHFERFQNRYAAVLSARPAPPALHAAGRGRHRDRQPGAGVRRRHRLLPLRRRRPDEAALPRAHRHAHRADRGAGRARSRTASAASFPTARSRPSTP